VLEGMLENMPASYVVEGANRCLLQKDVRPSLEPTLVVLGGLVWNLGDVAVEGGFGDVLVHEFEDILVVAEPFVVLAAGQHEQVAHVVLLALLTLFSHDFDRILQVLYRDLELVFLQVDAAQVVHAASQFLLVVQLLEDLGDLVVAD